MAMIGLDDMDVVEKIYNEKMVELFEDAKHFHNIDYQKRFSDWLDKDQIKKALEKKEYMFLTNLFTAILNVIASELDMKGCTDSRCICMAKSIKHEILAWRYELSSRWH